MNAVYFLLRRLCLISFVGGSVSSAADFEILEGPRTVSMQPEYYHGWSTVERRGNGELIAVWSGRREAHVCPFGTVEMMLSRDEGKTWTFPRTLLDSPIDDRDAGVLETAQGSLIVTTFTSLAYEDLLKKGKQTDNELWLATHRRLPDDAARRLELGEWAIRSTDGGITWSERIDTIVNSPHGPTQLKDGRLLYAGKKLWEKEKRIGVCESKDDGKTWTWLAEIPSREGDRFADYHELHAVECLSGKIVVHIRNHNPSHAGETLQCESVDGGKTWSVPREIGVWGLPSFLTRLRDGRLLMSYGHRRPPFGVQVRISPDEGTTWSEPLLLSTDGTNGDLGYPATVELGEAGTFFTLWYEKLKGSDKAVLRGTKWKLEDRSAAQSGDPWSLLAPHFEVPAKFRGDFGSYVSPRGNSELEWSKRRDQIREEWLDRLGKWPDLITEPKVEILKTERRENFTQQTLRFDWLPGQSTTGYLLIPDQAEKSPAVVTVYYEPETAAGLIEGSAGNHRDFALQLARRGFVALSLGTTETTRNQTYALYYPDVDQAAMEGLSALACAAANAWQVLAARPEVNAERIGITGHSYGGKWALFAACLFDKFAAVAVSDPGIMLGNHPSVNYWEPWYLGWHPRPWRKRGVISAENPAQGLYPRLVAEGRDLHEFHALLAPRPFLVSGGEVDPPDRWRALNHLVKLNAELGYENRVGMTNRPLHSPDADSNAVIHAFFEHFLGPIQPMPKR